MAQQPAPDLDWMVVTRPPVAAAGVRYAEALGFADEDEVTGYRLPIGPLLTPGILSGRPLATEFGAEGNTQPPNIGRGFTGTVYVRR